jgi:drug/metabolite transporter (DMT)-like permease
MTTSTSTVATQHRMWVVYSGAGVAMVAFAANSLLTRWALVSDGIDAATFTSVRLLSGALALTAILIVRLRSAPRVLARPAPLRSAAFLFCYAAAFSLAYVRIGAATGALVLFGTVQTVMYAAAIRRQEHIGASGWGGLALAIAGLVALVAPGVTAPDLGGVGLMVVAGAAWAGYTLAGRSVTDPIAASARNFVWSLPLVLAFELVVRVARPASIHVDAHGIGLAVASGAIASGMGYALWYSVLPRLTRVQSGILQMAPPPIAAVGGLALLGEPIGLRVVSASVLILSGVAVGVLGAARWSATRSR